MESTGSLLSPRSISRQDVKAFRGWRSRFSSEEEQVASTWVEAGEVDVMREQILCCMDVVDSKMQDDQVRLVQQVLLPLWSAVHAKCVFRVLGRDPANEPARLGFGELTRVFPTPVVLVEGAEM